MVDVWSNTQIDRMMRSVANGAAAHFRNTTKVVIVTEGPFLCPESAFTRLSEGFDTVVARRLKAQSMTADQKFQTS